MALSEGTTIGSYEVIGLIGQGGIDEVYQARDTKLDRDVEGASTFSLVRRSGM